MVPPPDKGVRVLRAAPGEDGAAWAAALATAVSGGGWKKSAGVLKDDAATTVWRARVNGRDVVVKCWALGGGARVKSMLGASRGFRHWRGAGWLGKHGFGTAKCFALVRGRADGRAVECLVMEALPGKSVLQHLADQDLSVEQEHALARELAAVTDRMTRSGRWNRDHKPSNLLVTGFDGERPGIAIIDCVGVRSSGVFGASTKYRRMAASLVLEPIGVGFPPRRALMARYCIEYVVALLRWHGQTGEATSLRVRRISFKRYWRHTASDVKRHGDPTPKVNPLK